MCKFKIIGMMTLVGFGIGMLLVGDARAQQKTLKDQLVGTWTLVSNDNVAPDGTKRQLFGPNPKGIVIYDANGRYAQFMVNPTRPKFKGKTRLDGTPEENKAVLQATTAHFGTWSVNEGDKTLTHHVEFHIFPNDDGSESKRTITITGDELKQAVATASAGGSSVTIWTRAR